MNPGFKILFSILATMALPSCGLAQMDVVSNIEEDIAGIENIVVNGGALEVSYEGNSQANSVFLNAYLESNSNDYEITYKVNGDILKVDLVGDGSRPFSNLKGFISLTGPENMNLEINSGSGTMFISNVSSDKIDLRTSSGKIEAKKLSSDRINVTASSGNMDMEGIHGQLFCKASSGGGKISQVDGDVSLIASSGSYRISDVHGVVSVSLSSGSILMENIEELGSLKISSGGIKASRAGLGANTRFDGSSGSFSVQTDDALEQYNFNLTARSGNLQVGETTTGKKLNINNKSDLTVSGAISSGSISIRN